MAIQSITLDPDAQSIQDQSVEIRNASGGAFAEGDLVYISGWDEAASRWLISLALASSFGGNLSQFVLRAVLADATDGVAFKSHRITGLDTSGDAEGDSVFLSGSVAGGFVTTAPDFARQIVGRVAVSDAVTGEIELFVQADSDTGFIRTNPGIGEFPIRAMKRSSGGDIEIDYDDVAI